MGNLPPIQTSCPAYVCSLRMPLGWASRTLTASRRRESMVSRSWRNMSGCWSYFLEMYWRIDDASETCVALRKGSDRTLDLQRGHGQSRFSTASQRASHGEGNLSMSALLTLSCWHQRSSGSLRVDRAGAPVVFSTGSPPRLVRLVLLVRLMSSGTVLGVSEAMGRFGGAIFSVLSAPPAKNGRSGGPSRAALPWSYLTLEKNPVGIQLCMHWQSR